MGKKLLLVDDERGTLALLAATLDNQEAYEILLAGDGEEALAVARQQKPDLVLLDVLMPKKDGYEVCRALKGEPGTAEIKVLILTALVQESDREKARQAGADGYFSKPFSPMALLKRIGELLN